MITVDFETEPIVGNPLLNPPRPVGVAILREGVPPYYLAFAHPSGNNSTWYEAQAHLARIRDSGEELLFHNAPFDISVWNQEFFNARLHNVADSWRRYHDTQYLLFLQDPYAPSLALKPSAEKHLGMPPEEQQELRVWILQHIPEATESNWGDYICRAPGDLVGKYAIGDVVRTHGLFVKLYPQVVENGMAAAYDRERYLSPRLVAATRHGIRADLHALEWHEHVYTACLENARSDYCAYLDVPDGLFDGPGADGRYADALDKRGAVESWVLTKTGKRSMAKENLVITDPTAAMYHTYIGKLETSLTTFMRPWLELGAHDGRLHPNWNQVRQEYGEFGTKGARTGRLSSDSPNFQNVPTEFVDAKGDPLATPPGVHPLPMLRRYLLPEEGHVWLKRDYSSQEVRLVAHFEDGSLCLAYRADPTLDPHQMAADIIAAVIGLQITRKLVKIVAFSLLYGSGLTGLSIKLHTDRDGAYQIKEAYLDAMPGVRALMKDVQARGRAGLPIKTIGGRLYYAEPSKIINGRLQEFYYKLLNYLIQGSAADQTKMSMVDWFEGNDWRSNAVFLATVHDELNISAPAQEWKRYMAGLQLAMDKERLDVPSRSEGFVGSNWQDIVPEEEYVGV